MDNTRTVTSTFGHLMTVFRNDHIGNKIAQHGLYEKETLTLLLTLLKRMQQPVALDIGANIGNHALAFATCAHTVHAFEPLPLIHDLLCRNVEQNAMTNIRVHNLALSDSEGSDTIFMVQDGNYGASSFDRRREAVEPVVIQKTTGDACLARLHVDRVDLVKIDVEAHEVYVLRGLMATIARHKPVITMEWNDPLTIQRLGGSPELKFLNEHYSIYVLGTRGDRGWWQGLPLGPVRRKLARWFGNREAVLYPFNPDCLYKNLLLIPQGREDLLAGIRMRQ